MVFFQFHLTFLVSSPANLLVCLRSISLFIWFQFQPTLFGFRCSQKNGVTQTLYFQFQPTCFFQNLIWIPAYFDLVSCPADFFFVSNLSGNFLFSFKSGRFFLFGFNSMQRTKATQAWYWPLCTSGACTFNIITKYQHWKGCGYASSDDICCIDLSRLLVLCILYLMSLVKDH